MEASRAARAGAQQTGVPFSRGDSGRATYALAQAARLAEAGRFTVVVGRTFPLDEVAEAHRVGEDGGVRGKTVLTVAPLSGKRRDGQG
nr:zinc-binding dehydrogenase [Actinoplanes solisilvae]